MNWKDQYKNLLWIVGFFLAAYFMPIEEETFKNSLVEAFALAKWYAQEHVILCLLPAFFIAGVIAVFVSKGSVIKYLGAKANKGIAYLVASMSGSILAICSCTVLPLFSSIYKRGAGLGPATAFLYSGPAINILAIILTSQILGFELGIARIIGAVSFSVIIGLAMSFIFRNEEKENVNADLVVGGAETDKPIWQIALLFFSLVGVLVFANWAKPEDSDSVWGLIYSAKWIITSLFGLAVAAVLIFILNLNKVYVLLGVVITTILSFLFTNPLMPFGFAIIALSIILSLSKDDSNEWMGESWFFAKQILPLLGAGVLAAGLLLGSPDGGEGLIPSSWISALVGGNSVMSNLFASVVGAFMYFATLTEIPILQSLIASGMGKGPALALLLAGPALSLPNMLVIRQVMGNKKTAVYIALVIVMSTITGIIYGILF